MKNRKIILILILGLFFIALSNVNAEDNSTVTLNHSNTEDIGISEADSTIDTDESNQNSADIVKIKDYNQKYRLVIYFYLVHGTENLCQMCNFQGL